MHKRQTEVKKEYRIYLVSSERTRSFPLQYPIDVKTIQDFERDCEAMGARVFMRDGEYYVYMGGVKI